VGVGDTFEGESVPKVIGLFAKLDSLGCINLV
jgi:hypothetical protein